MKQSQTFRLTLPALAHPWGSLPFIEDLAAVAGESHLQVCVPVALSPVGEDKTGGIVGLPGNS